MPHRALFDALMTHDILQHMLDVVYDDISAGLTDTGQLPQPWECIDRLVEMTASPVLLKKIRFGKHAGSLFSEVPVDYLQWCLRQDFDADVMHTCRHWVNK